MVAWWFRITLCFGYRMGTHLPIGTTHTSSTIPLPSCCQAWLYPVPCYSRDLQTQKPLAFSLRLHTWNILLTGQPHTEITEPFSHFRQNGGQYHLYFTKEICTHTYDAICWHNPAGRGISNPHTAISHAALTGKLKRTCDNGSALLLPKHVLFSPRGNGCF